MTCTLGSHFLFQNQRRIVTDDIETKIAHCLLDQGLSFHVLNRAQAWGVPPEKQRVEPMQPLEETNFGAVKEAQPFSSTVTAGEGS